MKSKLLKILTTIFLVCACVVSLPACNSNGSGNNGLAQIEITEKLYRDYVYLNVEYDVMNIVENKDSSLTYEITELFYLDSKLERVDIQYSGTKFTQTQPYDVNVTLKASKGNKSVEQEFVIEFAIESNQTADAFIGSWADEGVTRMLIANSDYLFNNSPFAIKVSYIGAIQRPNDGVNIGRLVASNSDMSVTNWENAVFTADVYNPQDYDLEMGILFGVERSVWTNDGSFEESYYYAPQVLRAKECTTVAWSLKYYNIVRDFLSDKDKSLQVKVRITDEYAGQFAAPYSYSLYINNLDITDYSQEKFPNLDTNYVAPIAVENEANTTFRNSYKSSVVSREVSVEDKYLRNDSKYAFKIGVNRTEDRAQDQIGNIGSAKDCSKTSWDNVVLTADVYNETNQDLVIGILFADRSNQIWLNDGKIENTTFLKPITLTANSWTTVAWSMKAFGITSNIFDNEIVIQVKTGFKNSSVLTSPYEYNLAITNLDFVDYSAVKFPDLDTNQPFVVQMNNGASESFRDSYKGSIVTRELTNESTYLHNGSTFAFNIAVNTDKTQASIIGMVESAEGCSKTNWENAVLTADVYNPLNYDLELGLTFADAQNNIWLNDGIIEDVSFVKPVTVTANGWTTVAWSMKAFGISSDIFTDGIVIQVKSRIKDTSGLSSYSYSMAITNLDFVDYSETKFPNLEFYYGTKKVNGNAKPVPITAGNISTISFDYCIINDVVKVALRKDVDNNNVYGIFEFNATGESEDYAGVTVTSLGNGYNRVVIDLTEANLKTTGTTIPAKTEINALAFQKWDGDYYFGNVKVTYQSES